MLSATLNDICRAPFVAHRGHLTATTVEDRGSVVTFDTVVLGDATTDKSGLRCRGIVERKSEPDFRMTVGFVENAVRSESTRLSTKSTVEARPPTRNLELYLTREARSAVLHIAGAGCHLGLPLGAVPNNVNEAIFGRAFFSQRYPSITSVAVNRSSLYGIISGFRIGDGDSYTFYDGRYCENAAK